MMIRRKCKPGRRRIHVRGLIRVTHTDGNEYFVQTTGACKFERNTILQETSSGLKFVIVGFYDTNPYEQTDAPSVVVRAYGKSKVMKGCAFIPAELLERSCISVGKIRERYQIKEAANDPAAGI